MAFNRDKYIKDYQTIEFEIESSNPLLFLFKWFFCGLFDMVKYFFRFMLDMPPFIGLILWILDLLVIGGTQGIILFIFPTLFYIFYPVFFLVRLLQYSKMKDKRISLDFAFGWVVITGFYLGLPFSFFDELRGEKKDLPKEPPEIEQKKQNIFDRLDNL